MSLAVCLPMPIVWWDRSSVCIVCNFLKAVYFFLVCTFYLQQSTPRFGLPCLHQHVLFMRTCFTAVYLFVVCTFSTAVHPFFGCALSTAVHLFVVCIFSTKFQNFPLSGICTLSTAVHSSFSCVYCLQDSPFVRVYLVYSSAPLLYLIHSSIPLFGVYVMCPRLRPRGGSTCEEDDRLDVCQITRSIHPSNQSWAEFETCRCDTLR